VTLGRRTRALSAASGVSVDIARPPSSAGLGARKRSVYRFNAFARHRFTAAGSRPARSARV
jgi:hypothetical protein